MLMTTEPGDLVIDPTCGSGTTAFVAEKQGRRWITCDTSRVAVTLAKKRLMSASFDYFALKYPHEGLKGGFIYKTVPHVTLKSIANNYEVDSIYEKYHPGVLETLDNLNDELSRMESGPSLTKMEEWEVPFDYPEDWPPEYKKLFEEFHAKRVSLQIKIDESISAHSGQETLFDQPVVSKNRLRITGPFTVEAVPFATVLGLSLIHI